MKIKLCKVSKINLSWNKWGFEETFVIQKIFYFEIHFSCCNRIGSNAGTNKTCKRWTPDDYDVITLSTYQYFLGKNFGQKIFG